MNKYFYFFSPGRVALYGVLVYFLFLMIAPVNLTIEFNIEAFLYIIFCYIVFFIGIFFANRGVDLSVLSRRRIRIFLDGLWISVSCVAFFGILLRIYSRFIARGYDISLSAMDNRNVLDSAGSSLMSIPAAILYPFSYIPIFIWLAMKNKTYFGLFVSLIFFIYPVVDGILVNSRNAILISILMLALFVFLFSSKELSSKKNVVLFSGFFFLILVFLFLFLRIFENRLESMDMDIAYSIYNSVYAFTAQPEFWIVELITSKDSLRGVALLYLNLSQYYISGVFEFFYMHENFKEGVYAWGGNIFFPVYKLYLFFLGDGSDPLKYIYEMQPRTGVYLSFFGPLYVDFGWFGLVVMLFFGWGFQKIYVSLCFGNIFLTPLYCYLLLVVLFFPVLNLIQSAQGLYVVSSFILFYFIARRFFSYTVIYKDKK